MELKLILRCCASEYLISFNRTTMELKYGKTYIDDVEVDTF